MQVVISDEDSNLITFGDLCHNDIMFVYYTKSSALTSWAKGHSRGVGEFAYTSMKGRTVTKWLNMKALVTVIHKHQYVSFLISGSG